MTLLSRFRWWPWGRLKTPPVLMAQDIVKAGDQLEAMKYRGLSEDRESLLILALSRQILQIEDGLLGAGWTRTAIPQGWRWDPPKEKPTPGITESRKS